MVGADPGFRYFNIIQASHHPIWSSQGYKDNCKRLDLENTRELLPGEEPVGCKAEMMVFDVCNAQFSIYELVGEDMAKGYHSHPKRQKGQRKVLVAVNVNGDGDEAREVLSGIAKDVESATKGEVYASLYKHAGEEAQPYMHPPIEKADVGGGKWLGLVAIVGEEGLGVEEVQIVLKEREGKRGASKIGVWEEVLEVRESKQ